MEDIVAVRVTLDTNESRYFLTWGRIMGAVDPRPIEQVIRTSCKHVALGGTPVHVQICDSLQDASHERYFYECFFQMCQKKIPFGPDYATWAAEMAEKMESGREIYYLGMYDQSP